MKLTDLQQTLITQLAEDDLRSPQEMLALLLSEGFRFLYCDNRPVYRENTDTDAAALEILNELRQSVNLTPCDQ